MSEINEFYPFSMLKHESTYSLSLAQDLKWDAFEANDYLGNGHDWGRMMRNILAVRLPEKLEALSFDCGADIFSVYSEDVDVLKEVSQIAAEFYDDDEKLVAHIVEFAKYEE